MRRIEPDGPAAPAKADDPEPVRVTALQPRPSNGCVEIGKQLAVGLAVDERHKLRRLRDLGKVAARRK
jgi:hypothetical protein